MRIAALLVLAALMAGSLEARGKVLKKSAGASAREKRARAAAEAYKQWEPEFLESARVSGPHRGRVIPLESLSQESEVLSVPSSASSSSPSSIRTPPHVRTKSGQVYEIILYAIDADPELALLAVRRIKKRAP